MLNWKKVEKFQTLGLKCSNKNWLLFEKWSILNQTTGPITVCFYKKRALFRKNNSCIMYAFSSARVWSTICSKLQDTLLLLKLLQLGICTENSLDVKFLKALWMLLVEHTVLWIGKQDHYSYYSSWLYWYWKITYQRVPPSHYRI